MKILLAHDVISTYLQPENKVLRQQIENQVYSIINNKYNIFLFSKYYLKLLENFFNKIDPNLKSAFESLILELMDEIRTENLIGRHSDSLKDEFEHLHKNYKQNDTFTITLKPLSHKLAGNICALKHSRKPNRDWLILKLVTIGNCYVTYHDFATNSEINGFFNDFFSLSPNITYVTIIDDYLNFAHRNYQYLKNKKIPVKYYTTSYDKHNKQPFDTTKLTDFKNRLTTTFQSTSELYVTTRLRILHRRHAITDKLILFSNHDFAQLNHYNKNWRVDITYNENLLKDILMECGNYTKAS